MFQSVEKPTENPQFQSSQDLSPSHPLKGESETLVVGRGVPIPHSCPSEYWHCENNCQPSHEMFLSSSHFAILKSLYSSVNLKVNHVKCLEAMYSGRDVIMMLMGYGKSRIFHLLSLVLADKRNNGENAPSSVNPVIVVISPLSTLIKDQISEKFLWNNRGTTGLQIISRLVPVRLSGQTYQIFCSGISIFGRRNTDYILSL